MRIAGFGACPSSPSDTSETPYTGTQGANTHVPRGLADGCRQRRDSLPAESGPAMATRIDGQDDAFGGYRGSDKKRTPQLHDARADLRTRGDYRRFTAGLA